MADQRYTIIIVPHAQSNPRKFQVSRKTLSYAVIGSVLLCLVSLGSIFNQVRMYKKTQALARLQQENNQLRASLDESRQLSQRLNRKISQLNDLSNKLRVMAGLPQPEKKQEKLGMGGFTETSSFQHPEATRLEGLEKKANILQTSLMFLKNYFKDQKEQLSTTPSIFPADGFISSTYGSRQNPFTNARDFHEGLDLSNDIGTRVMAPADGVVIYAGQKGSYGEVVEIRHDENTTTLYGHLDKILVKAGDKVTRRQTIALMGNSGKSTGPHLHYEVHVNGQPVNPQMYILDDSPAMAAMMN